MAVKTTTDIKTTDIKMVTKTMVIKTTTDIGKIRQTRPIMADINNKVRQTWPITAILARIMRKMHNMALTRTIYRSNE